MNDYAPLVFVSDRDIESGMFDAEGEPLTWKKKPSGSISKEEFFDDKVPVDESVFKDPLMAAGKLYVNEAAKAVLEKLLEEAGIIGAAFVEPGPPPKKPRPRA